MRQSFARRRLLRTRAVESLEGRRLLTVLTFDRLVGTSTTGASLTQPDLAATSNYGDRVNATTVTSPIANTKYTYKSDLGFTPNVTAAFGPVSGTTPLVAGWPTAYGDLVNIVYGTSGKIEITLNADAGYQVKLHSFDLGGWSNTDYTVKSVQVFNGATKAYEALNYKVEGDLTGARHSTVNFATPLQGQSLKIVIDATTTVPAGGGANIGIDNVKFSQAVQTGSIDLIAGKLTINGSDNADNITVNPSGTNLIATVGSLSKTFAASAVTAGILVDARGGNDNVTINSAVTKPSTLKGGDGNDNLTGGGANDLLDGGNGSDKMAGAGGVDTADYSTRTAALYVFLDTFGNDGGFGEKDNVQTENVIGGSASDVMVGDASANNLDGRGGGDYLLGQDGNDSLLGGDGDDNLMGGNGNDSLVGGTGVDQLFGEAGDDTIDLKDSTTVAEFGDGGAGAADKVRKDAADLVLNCEQTIV
ncbi:MAG: hypothetical protein QM770_12405 [Tepidisphaeraceae bacterium]